MHLRVWRTTTALLSAMLKCLGLGGGDPASRDKFISVDTQTSDTAGRIGCGLLGEGELRDTSRA